MTKVTSSLDMFKDFDRFFVGFDDQWNKLNTLHDAFTKGIPNYPPYNIRKVDEDRYVIELAVAGFGKSEIDITLDGDKLIVNGEAKDGQDNFIYKGIANRAFTRTFSLADHIEIDNAELMNGMLRIWLEKIIPEHKKPKKIEVKTDTPSPSKQLLTEDDL
jgi:molecular chaperone IbpA